MVDCRARAGYGSISAHAEEPGPPTSSQCVIRVYLRTRGGTGEGCGATGLRGGLSAHTRRNLRLAVVDRVDDGSISAHAEEPDRCRRQGCATRVYLRTRGGTHAEQAGRTRMHGLSPHTRRNLEKTHRARRVAGSISAHAEEPQSRGPLARCSAVYLRTRGGTLGEAELMQHDEGLSPHTRRNRHVQDETGVRTRSISAHAEEPLRRSRCSRHTEVYLRTRGGTPTRRRRPHGRRGLSPHTRRNHQY